MLTGWAYCTVLQGKKLLQAAQAGNMLQVTRLQHHNCRLLCYSCVPCTTCAAASLRLTLTCDQSASVVRHVPLLLTAPGKCGCTSAEPAAKRKHWLP